MLEAFFKDSSFRAKELCKFRDDGVSELAAFPGAAEVSSEVFALLQYCVAGALNAVSVVVQLQVPQHHDGREQQGGGVGQVLASDVRGCAVHLHEANITTNN